MGQKADRAMAAGIPSRRLVGPAMTSDEVKACLERDWLEAGPAEGAEVRYSSG
jgi:hypothetical protein